MATFQPCVKHKTWQHAESTATATIISQYCNAQPSSLMASTKPSTHMQKMHMHYAVDIITVSITTAENSTDGVSDDAAISSAMPVRQHTPLGAAASVQAPHVAAAF